jgi:hypothetical protein
MTRITAPAPTRNKAPSHSPPDTRYVPGNDLVRFLGWFSIGLGAAETFFPREMARLTGVPHPKLLQAYGLREIVTGLGILSCARPTGWLWARVAGDVLDLATLGEAMLEADDGEQRQRIMLSTAAVAGVAALDLACSGTLSAVDAMEG